MTQANHVLCVRSLTTLTPLSRKTVCVLYGEDLIPCQWLFKTSYCLHGPELLPASHLMGTGARTPPGLI